MSDGMFHELNTGDVTDDDWEVFDDALQQSPIPPEPSTDTPVVNKTVDPPVLTRIMAVTMLPIAAGPWQAAWPDPKRRELHIRVFGDDDSTNAVFMSDPYGLGFPVNNGSGDVVLTGHTGALWVANPDNKVSVWSVTE